MTAAIKVSAGDAPIQRRPIRVALFGATGMIGQGVLRECLLDPTVTKIIVVGRRAADIADPKVEQCIVADPGNLAAVRGSLAGVDACIWCLGISAAGLGETEYRRVTYDLAVRAATTLVEIAPAATFVFVSGAGADSTERGRVMWARVKGATENALLKLPFRGVYSARPAFIQPLHGSTSRTALYRVFYVLARPLFPLLRRLAPGWVTTTEELAQVLITLGREGTEKRVLEQRELNVVASSGSAHSA